MGDFEIIRRNGTKTPLFSQEPFCAVKSATQNCTLMGDDNVQLSIVSSVIMSFDKGDKIIINGEEYSIRTLPTRQMQSDTYYTYDVTFYGVMYELMKTIYRNTDADGKSTSSSFDLTYSIRDFVKVLIYNVERDYPGLWNFDEVNCPETEPITITFSNNNCLQVLQTLCSDDNFKLEFRITQENGVRTIHIGKFGAKVVPPGGGDYFEWGRGNGLYTLTEKKVDDKAIITRLWVEGGTTNIRSDYRNYSERLQLPYPKRMNEHEHTLSDGTVIAANSEMIGIDDDNKRYIEDAQLRDKYGSDEDAAQYDKIYPKRTGKVTALVGDDVNSFIDDTMDFDLNEKDENGTKWLIAETTAKINFITGRLAGQQFELAAKNGYDHTTKKFTIIAFTDERGLTIPTADNEAYRINVGDQYNITDIHLPKAYEDDAEEDLWYAGYDDFKPRTQPQAQYELTLDRAYFIDALPDDSETCVFHVGDYVPIRDTRFGIEKNIRIQKVSRNLLTEQDYSLTLADTVAVSVYTQTVLDVIDHDIIIENNGLRNLNKARRGWRTTEELRNMVYDTDGYFDTDNIRPNSIDTNMLTVGSKSQQFILGGVVFQPNYNGDPNNFVATSGVLAHLTIDENNIRQWSIGASQTTLVSSAGYYLFAKCSRDGQSGVWYITQEQMKFEDESDPNNYYFLVGILSSVYADENFRDFTATYGFTRINGRTITTGRVQSSTKESYFDLDSDTFKLGDALSFNLNGNKVLRLKGALVQSESGDEDYIGCYRGVYNPKYTYFKGDEVSYESNGNTSTYRMINNNPCVGVAPTNTVYWQVLAQGSKGDKGEDGTSISIDGHCKGHYLNFTALRSSGIVLRENDSFILDDSSDYSETEGGVTQKGYAAPSIMTYWNAPDFSWSCSKAAVGDGYVDDVTGHLWQADSEKWKDLGKIQGVGISKVEEFYLTSANNTGITVNTSGWTATVQTPTKDKRYLWNYEQITYTDGKVEKTQPCIIGMYSEDGRGISSIVEYYCASSSKTIVPSTWSTTPPALTATLRYLWNYEVITYTDGTSSETTPKVIGVYGDKGDDGKYTELRYAKNGSTTTPPILNKASLVPAGWSTTMPSVGTLEYLWMTSAVKSADGNTLVQQWATPVRVSPYDGKDGKSPALVYRGEYDSSKTYYGNEFRLDCVKYGDMHYVARIDAGTFYGVIPTNTSKWNQFGAQFESVATQLLLAELANIGNFIIKNNCIISQKGTINGVESTDYSNPNFVPNIMLDGQNGQSVLCGSQRSPFVRFDGSWYVGSDFSSLAECYDNLVFPISETGGWEENINFPWSTKCNGRKITLVNYKWGNETPSGKFEIEAPTGKYFYEDGIQKDKLQFSREVIELLGYGDNTTFFGWIVVGRHDIATVSKYGRTFKVLAMGEVTGTKSSASIKYHTFDGSTLSVERRGTGIYKITHSSQWFASVDDRMVILSGVGYVAGGDSPVKATYISSGATAISVHTSDDESRNDGSFQFLIANLSNWSYD